jgi:hypothetical protein
VINNDTSQASLNNANQPNFDVVTNFAVGNANTALNDALSLPGTTLASVTGGWHDGADSGVVKSHNIGAGGALSFGSANNGTPLVINDSNLGAALSYLANNLGANQTVAFAYDKDGNGSADSTIVYQTGSFSPLAVLLDGVTGATLGNAAGQNIIQLVDSTAPEINGVSFGTGSNVTVNFSYSENVTAANLNGLTLLKNGTGSNIVDAVNTTSPLAIQTTATFTAGDWLLVSYDGASGTIQDDSGNKLGDIKGAIGSENANAMDLSSLPGGGLHIGGNGGNDTLTGGSGNDNLEGGSGADTLNGGGGTNQFDFTQGDSTTVSLGNLVNGHVNDGSTYTFSGGADVITGGLTLNSSLHLYNNGGNNMQATLAPSSGLVGDQQFFLQQGNYNTASGVFTVNGNGTDTLVVYDGDGSAGVSQTALVMQYRTPDSLNTDDNRITVSSSPVASLQWINNLNNTGLLTAGNQIKLDLHFSEAVSVSNGTTLSLELGTAASHKTVQATLLSGSGTSDLVFGYTVQASDNGLYHLNTNSGNVVFSGGSVVTSATGQAATIAISNQPASLPATYIYGSSVGTSAGTAGNDLFVPNTDPSKSLTGSGVNYTLNSTYYHSGLLDPFSSPPSPGQAGSNGYVGGTSDIRWSTNSATGTGLDTVYIPVQGTTITTTGFGASLKVIVDQGLGTEKQIALTTLPSNVQALFFQLTDAGGTPIAGSSTSVYLGLASTISIDPINGHLFVRGSINSDTANLGTSPFSSLLTSTTQVMVSGAAGGDTLTGGAGINVFRGDGGTNTVTGTASNDAFLLSNGSDTIHGQGGTDTLIINTVGDFLHSYIDAAGALHVQGAALATPASYSDEFVLTPNLASGNFSVLSNRYNLTSTVDGVEQIQFRTSGGNGSRETITLLTGTTGDDSSLAISAGAGHILGIAGAGNDAFTVANTAKNTLDGGSGTDSVTLQLGNGLSGLHLSQDSNNSLQWHVLDGVGNNVVDITARTAATGTTISPTFAIDVLTSGVGAFQETLVNIEALKFVDTLGASTLLQLTLGNQTVIAA